MKGAIASVRWSLVVAGFTINLCLGTIYAWSVFRKPLESSPYSLTQADSILPFSVFLLAFGISFAFSGRMIGQVGPRRPALIGAALLGVGYLLCYAIAFVPSQTLWVTVVGFGIVAGTGCGFAYSPPIAVVGQWFVDGRGLALGLTVMGFGLSALFTAPIVSSLVSLVGLAKTFLLLGAVYFVVLCALGARMKFPPAEWKTVPVSANRSQPWRPSALDFAPHQVVRTSVFYVTWLIFLFGAGAGLMVIGYAKPIAQTITGLTGSSDWLATLAVQVLAVSNALGRPIFGSLCDRIGPRNTLLTMQGIQLLCLVVLFPLAGNLLFLYLSIIMFAATFGAYLSVMPTLACCLFGTENMGPNYGLYLSAYGLGGVVFPMLLAFVLGPAPNTTTYTMGFYITGALVVAAMVLSFGIRTPKPPKHYDNSRTHNAKP